MGVRHMRVVRLTVVGERVTDVRLSFRGCDAISIIFGVFLNGRGQIELRNPQLDPHPQATGDARYT